MVLLCELGSSARDTFEALDLEEAVLVDSGGHSDRAAPWFLNTSSVDDSDKQLSLFTIASMCGLELISLLSDLRLVRDTSPRCSWAVNDELKVIVLSSELRSSALDAFEALDLEEAVLVDSGGHSDRAPPW